MANNYIINKYYRYVIITLLVIILSVNIIIFDVNIISDFFYEIVSVLNSNNFFSLILILIIFLLRSISIIIPVLPGTIFSAAAGFQFGFTQGLVIIFFADFFSCLTSFLLARKLGRNYISRLLGSRQMLRVESISQDYI